MKNSALTPLERALVAAVVAAAKDQPAAARVWVFGSRARGASTVDSDLDIAVEFSAAESRELRDWLDRLRSTAEAPVADQWPGFVDLVGLYADDADIRLRRRIHAEGLLGWQRVEPAQPVKAAVPRPVARSG
jgi:predicted nucleotidyltransferase